MSSLRKCAGRLFQTRGPAAAMLLSPNVLCVRGTAHDLLVDERSRCLGPSEIKCMSSVKYGGALLENDEKTKHANLKSTHLWTGRGACAADAKLAICSPRLAPVRSRAAAFCTDWTFQVRPNQGPRKNLWEMLQRVFHTPGFLPVINQHSQSTESSQVSKI